MMQSFFSMKLLNDHLIFFDTGKIESDPNKKGWAMFFKISLFSKWHSIKTNILVNLASSVVATASRLLVAN
jgi:hypothetical protein